MLIAQISDTHLIVDGEGSDRRLADFRDVIADINALRGGVDIIIHTGDIVHNGTPEEYDAAAEILSGSHAPAYVLPGNKDDRANLHDAFAGQGYLPTNADFLNYSIEHFPIRLLTLDTTNPNSKKGDFCDARFENLEQMLQIEPEKPVAVFAHHPPFEVHVGPERLHYDDRQVMDRLADTIAGSKAQHLFCGHLHRPTSGAVGDTPATVMTACATELRFGEYPDKMTGKPTYLLHHYREGQGFSTEIRIVEYSV